MAASSSPNMFHGECSELREKYGSYGVLCRGAGVISTMHESEGAQPAGRKLLR